MSPDKENRPGLASEAISTSNAGGVTLIVPELTDEYARHIDGAFVVIAELPGEKYRRRCFLTIKSAERAVRAAQARGHNARIYLAELRPLFRVVGGGDR